MESQKLKSRLSKLSENLRGIEESVSFPKTITGEEIPSYPQGDIDGKGKPDVPHLLSMWILRFRAFLLNARSRRGHVPWLDALLHDRLGVRPTDLPFHCDIEHVEEVMWAQHSLIEGLRFLVDAVRRDMEDRGPPKSAKRPVTQENAPFWSKEYAAKLLGVSVKTLVNKVSAAKQAGREIPWVSRAGAKRGWRVDAKGFLKWMKARPKKRGRPRKYAF